MKIVAKYNSKYIDENNNILLNLKIDDYWSKRRIESLEKSKNYQIEIKEVKSKRSLEQNKLLWAIIRGIVEAVRTTDYDYDEIRCYIDLLKESNCKYEYYIVPNDEAINKLKTVCRAVEFIKMQVVNGKQFKMVKCYLGSSKFNVIEMNHLIEIAKKWASEFDLYYD